MSFLTPFSQIVKYSSPDGKGIYVKPHSEANPDGWGEPRVDEEGQPITPGTPGGDFANTLILKKENEFKASSTKYRQKAGNITWWGKYRDEAIPAKGRHVLSYAGPKLRHFREIDFTYGSSPEHNEIYYLGAYAAVAPGPVIGACLRQITYQNPATEQQETSTFIVVAVYRNGGEEFYRKRWNYSTIAPFKMTDSVRQAQMEVFEADENPTGWELIGTFARPGDDYFPPETPWFFNESGTEAITMRRKTITFDNGSGSQVTEDVFERMVLTLTDTTASVSLLGNELPMEYEETIVKTHPTYHQEADFAGFSHDWQEDHVHVDFTLTGEQWVMCDYLGDTRYWGKVKYNMYRSQHSYYTEGTDPAPYTVTYEGQPKDISNNGMLLGPQWLDYFEYGYVDESYVPSEADHERTDWIKITEVVKLYYGPEGNEEDSYIDLHVYTSGTSDEWAGNPRQDDNPFLFFYQFYTRYMRALFDIRDLALFAQDQYKYGLFQQGNTASIQNQYKDKLYTSDNLSGETYRNITKSAEELVEFGWTEVEMNTWPDEITETLTRQTYTGKWPADNHDGETQVPGNKTFYKDPYGDTKSDWPTIEDLLYGKTGNDCKGNGVRTEQSTVCFSVEVPDMETEGSYVVLSDHKTGGDPASIVGFGEKFYPVGSC